ncbi:Orn/Lys/Arg decarboxylase [Candidatus Arthromitus sp. SFB-mouse-Japan]|uniref:aminotransferase class I/II-fold pyridoxal phosphate-dependent enzyme n=1 Tax=unclassified Candidatus Neoarthromitus TaxID=2638829 RepID=UPI00021B816D|nr:MULTISPECIES: aminotransferase class I/II-fold pyridoxal phosphate-dependent enzyme [unclassified Candidatus Arthromitus]EIA22606.1 Putative lysine decarboxylase [Candidatus Arthromitus sp. SFB-3]EIA24932.1 Putative lysine decarboxylase [Candidatus Arthromitus sp. SFB-2]EIA26655.1 Putative lysine decarboxylase [Candidatus Arthromitus sp. SFB-4]EIA29389.1 Putative lysine decarboxylase [Candidatus Arthromitus sp. SFB-co]EIA29482.1 Putative lysine decarboxylase [Candidatus Arthromitus sp. SFB-
MGELIKSIERYLGEEYSFFTTPGHKQGNGYNYTENLFKYDLTEIEGLDNLHNPYECINDSLNNLSKFYESKKSYYLVNGSTSGIHIMFFSCFDEGDTILVERGCHKSVINALILRKLKVLYVNRDKYNVDLLMPDKFSFIDYNEKDIIFSDIVNIIENNKNVRGVVLTNPNYYGIYVDQKGIYSYLKKRNILLLIDGAHGAHIKAFNKKIDCVNKFCDISVMSAHKTLASLTQGAYLHVNKSDLISKVDEYFCIFTTTSPSYLILMSLEKGLDDCVKYKNIGYSYVDECDNFRELLVDCEIIGIDNNCIINRSNSNFLYDDSRLCLKFKYGNMSSNDLYNYLLKKKIVCEMTYFNGIVLIPTYCSKKNDFQKLYYSINEFKGNEYINNIFEIFPKIYDLDIIKVFEPYEILHKPYEFLEIEKCVGKVAFNDIFLYPPGTPIIVRGEYIESKHMEVIFEYLKLNCRVNGVFDGKYLKVLEENIKQ